METLTSTLHWRYATKQFDSTKKVSDNDLHDLLESLRLAPSSFGIQAWKFLVITDPKLRAKLREHAWNQPQVTDASHLIVLLARKTVDDDYINKYITHTAEVRKIPVESLDGMRTMLLNFSAGLTPEAAVTWNKKQTYIALGFLMFAAAQKRIDACPMEGFDAAKIDEVLGLEEYTVATLCPVGYRSPDDKYASAAKVRFDARDVIEHR